MERGPSILDPVPRIWLVDVSNEVQLLASNGCWGLSETRYAEERGPKQTLEKLIGMDEALLEDLTIPRGFFMMRPARSTYLPTRKGF